MVGEIVDARLRGEPLDEARQVLAKKRFTAGQTCFHADVDERIDEAVDLLELQDVVARQPDIVLLRHAVLATRLQRSVIERRRFASGRCRNLVARTCDS